MQVVDWVIKNENRKRATILLETFFNKLDSDDEYRFIKAYTAQTVARVCLENKVTWDDAEKWAQEAVRLQPYSFAISDTMGQVYRTKLR